MPRHLATSPVRLALSLLTALLALEPLAPSIRADDLCGNGSIDSPSEECDDGNSANGDCCSATCKLEPPGTHCDNHSVCAQEGACNSAGTCIDLGCRVGARCRGGDGAAATYCAYPSGGPCSCTASTSTPLPDCTELTTDFSDEWLEEADTSLEAKGLGISEVGPEDYSGFS